MLQNDSHADHGRPGFSISRAKTSEEDETAGLLSPTRKGDLRPTWTKLTLWLLIGLCITLTLCTCLSSLALIQLSRQLSQISNLAPRMVSASPAAAGISLDAAVSAMNQGFPTAVDLSQEACSNNGMLYSTDGSCHCFACYQGPTCTESIPLEDCTVDAGTGTPLIFEEYWRQHPEAEFRLRASDNIGYLQYSGSLLPRLEAAIRRLHALVGNAVTEGREIVVGTGSVTLITAAMYGFAGGNWEGNITEGTAKVMSSVPYYSAYPSNAQYPASRYFEWYDGPTEQLNTSRDSVIEIVTAPNNPDGAMKNQTVPGSRVIYDHAYYWPHYAAISKAVEYTPNDLAIFTLSKLTGHASTRIGWAIVEDAKVAQAMRNWIWMNGIVAIEGQAKAAGLLEFVTSTQGDLFKYGRAEMQRRWGVLQEIGASSQRLSFQSLQAASDTWSSNNLSPSPPYLWVHCVNHTLDPDCTATLKQAGLIARPGQAFGSSVSHARLALLMRAQAFDHMADKLRMMG